MRNNKIVIITGVFPPEPVVSAGLMSDLAEALSKDYNVTVLRPHPTRPKGFKMPAYDFKDQPYEVVEVDNYTCPQSSLLGRFRESYSMGKACMKYLEDNHQNICMVYNGPWHVFARDMVRKVCNKYHIPYVTPVQDIYPEALLSKLPKVGIMQKMATGLLMPYDSRLLQDAKLVHTISNGIRDYLSETRQLPKDKFVVVRNWQNEQAFIEYREKKGSAATSEEAPFTFMYLGNVGPLAGIDVLFDALKKAKLPEARLVIAGSGSAKQHLMEKAKDYQDCKIEFWEVPAGEVPATQDKADVMVLPVKKGFAMSSIPSKLPAYMFSAKPVLASVDVGSDTAQCVVNAKGGWVAEPENVESIAAAMRKAYETSQEELATIGERGFKYAIDNFSRGKNLEKLVRACKSVIR